MIAVHECCCDLSLHTRSCVQGEKLTLLGLTQSNQPVTLQAVVKSLDYFNLMGADTHKVPVFRPYNTGARNSCAHVQLQWAHPCPLASMRAERVDFEPSDRTCRGGVYLDTSGDVRCLWSLFEDGEAFIQAGVPTSVLVEVSWRGCESSWRGRERKGWVAVCALQPIRQVMSRLAFGTPITLRTLEVNVVPSSHSVVAVVAAGL